MSTQGLRKCCHCDIWFRPHGRNAHHQQFCMKPECRAASKRASQMKWSRKNPGYFHGDAYVKKVQAWRRKHPGYWKTAGATEDCAPPDALQDLLVTQGFGNEDVKVFRNCLSAEISRPLQDLLPRCLTQFISSSLKTFRWIRPPASTIKLGDFPNCFRISQIIFSSRFVLIESIAAASSMVSSGFSNLPSSAPFNIPIISSTDPFNAPKPAGSVGIGFLQDDNIAAFISGVRVSSPSIRALMISLVKSSPSGGYSTRECRQGSPANCIALFLPQLNMSWPK